MMCRYLDPVLARAAEARHRLDVALRVPHLELIGAHAHLDALADQAAVHRVAIARDPDQAAAGDPHVHPCPRVLPALRQASQVRQFHLEARAAPGIEGLEHLFQKRLVRRARGEVTAAAQQQRLVDRLLDPVMPLLDVAVLMGLRRLDPTTVHPIVRQQRLIPPGEHLGVNLLVHRGAQAIRPMRVRGAAELPQRCLQPRLRRSKLSVKHTVPHSQFEYGNTKWYSR